MGHDDAESASTLNKTGELYNVDSSVNSHGAMEEEQLGFIKQEGGDVICAVETAKSKHRGRFNNLLKDGTLRHQFLHMSCICLYAVSSGWRLSMTGPALPDLRLIIDENLSRASWIISAMSLGGLIGSVCGGFLYDRLNKYTLFVILPFIMAAASIATPWCSNFASMIAAHAVVGLCSTGVNTIIPPDISAVWGKDKAPFLQAANFAFSLGATFSPLAIEPFLAKRRTTSKQSPNETFVVNSTFHLDSTGPKYHAAVQLHEESMRYNASNETGDPEAWAIGTTTVHFAYLISGIICLLASISFVTQYCLIGNVHKKRRDKWTHGDDKTTKEEQYPLTKGWRILFIVLLTSMLTTYVVSERTFYNYLMTYLVEHLNWNKSDGSNVTTVFWTTFMIGRLFSIGVVRFIDELVVFTMFLAILLLGEVLMLVSVRLDIPALIWVSCGLYGLGFAPLHANITSWLASKVCPLTGKVSSVLFTTIAVGSFIFPLLLGNMMSSVSYDWFIYLQMILTGLLGLMLAIAEVLYRKLTKCKTHL